MAYNLDTGQIIWNHSFEKQDEFYQLVDMKYDVGRLYVHDSLGTLHIFEKE
ncbi:MAG: hypothetical protein H7Y04_11400 [Verrucomicrobia bacterium]|nr:hypothetical protein [Cytophagales bacterium]